MIRIFGNLVNNTLNFVPSTPVVHIQIGKEQDRIVIHYRDNGPGIEEHNLARVFEPYFSTREHGTGLGLFIIRQFVEEMGGTIQAIPSGSGVHFTLIFRKA
ncbi:MAG: ATP-binding protein [Desulfobacterales bacterium]|nr:ATP-binding protein [Desulfobacterales bacterium]